MDCSYVDAEVRVNEGKRLISAQRCQKWKSQHQSLQAQKFEVITPGSSLHLCHLRARLQGNPQAQHKNREGYDIGQEGPEADGLG